MLTIDFDWTKRCREWKMNFESVYSNGLFQVVVGALTLALTNEDASKLQFFNVSIYMLMCVQTVSSRLAPGDLRPVIC